MNTEKLFDSYAEDYQEKFNQNPVALYQRKLVYDLVEPLIKEQGNVLDIGCGPGSDFAFYKAHNLNVEAIDISKRMVDLARQNSEKLNLRVNIFHSSLQDFLSESLYDVIIMNFGVLNVFCDPEEVLKKLDSLLARDGILVLVLMPPFHLFSILESVAKLKFSLAFKRLFKHRAVLDNGFKFSYYHQKDLISHFKLINKRNLAILLPTPDQYSRWAWARMFTRFVQTSDEWLSTRVPDFVGGDHVCYILKKSLSYEILN
jgi:2-polyprenyl-3-methyl-5-hydroxy-6-metoxy-1,4-benzoquinol methylase